MNKSKNEVIIMPQYFSACGIDIHKDIIYVYASDNRNEDIYSGEFGSTTRQLKKLVAELVKRKIEIVLMESTGIYWISLYHLLIESGLRTVVANPGHIKQLPKQKTDKKDAKWLCKIAINNMVRHSIVPGPHQHELREFVRMRQKYTQQETSCYNRIVKIIERGNIKLRSVASSIRTKTCQLIIEAIMKGQTNPKILASLALGKLKKKKKEIEEAVEGKLTPTDIKILRLLKEDLSHIQNQITKIDQQIDLIISEHYQLDHDLLMKVTGIGIRSSHKVLAEIGNNLSKFYSADHLTSWTGIAPGNNESAGKKKYTKTKKGNVHLKTTMVQIAWSAVRTKNSYWNCKMAEYKKRMKAQKAIFAIARRMLKLIYKIITTKMVYTEGGSKLYMELQQRRKQYLTLKSA